MGIYEGRTIKNAERRKKIWLSIVILRTTRKSHHSILDEVRLDCLLEALIKKPMLRYLEHLTKMSKSLKKSLMLGKIKGTRKLDNRVRCYHRWCKNELTGTQHSSSLTHSPVKKNIHHMKKQWQDWTTRKWLGWRIKKKEAMINYFHVMPRKQYRPIKKKTKIEFK